MFLTRAPLPRARWCISRALSLLCVPADQSTYPEGTQMFACNTDGCEQQGKYVWCESCFVDAKENQDTVTLDRSNGKTLGFGLAKHPDGGVRVRVPPCSLATRGWHDIGGAWLLGALVLALCPLIHSSCLADSLFTPCMCLLCAPRSSIDQTRLCAPRSSIDQTRLLVAPIQCPISSHNFIS